MYKFQAEINMFKKVVKKTVYGYSINYVNYNNTMAIKKTGLLKCSFN